MSSDPNYEWEQLLDIDDSDLPLTPVLRPCNNHVRETTTTTTTQNPVVDNLEKKPVRIIPGPAGIVQLAKLRKQSDIHEGGDESVLSTQEYMKKVVEDVGDIKNFFKNEKLEQVVAIIKSCTSNALSDLTVVTPPDEAWTEYVSGGVTLLNISSTKHKERPLRVSDQRQPNQYDMTYIRLSGAPWVVSATHPDRDN
ncbi:hypothetical protein Tco_0262316 [Tanacetum coccineum]